MVLTDKYCPHCKQRFEFQIGLGNDGMIGRPARLCPLCHEVMATGQVEWADARVIHKMRHLCYAALWSAGGALTGGAVGGLLAGVLQWDFNNFSVAGWWLCLPIVGAVAGIVLGGWASVNVIRESLRRTGTR